MIHTMELLVSNVRPFELFSYTDDLKKCRSNCFKAEYKGIGIKYYMTSLSLILIVNVLDIMQKDLICVGDLAEFKRRIQRIVYELIRRKNVTLKVNRVDYFCDLHFDDNELFILENDLLYKHKHGYKYMKVRKIYKTSLAVKTRYGKMNISMYNKAQERLDNDDFEGAKKYKGIFRIELQVKKRAIKQLLKQDGISQDIENYFSKWAFLNFFGEIYRNYLHVGINWRLDFAHELVHKSDYKEFVKTRLCIFLTKVNQVRYEWHWRVLFCRYCSWLYGKV